MAVDRADVIETKFFKQSGGQHQAFGLVLQTTRQLKQRRRIFQNLAAHLFGGRVKTPAHELRQIAVQSAHGRTDRHVVVVQDDQQIAVGHTCVVHGLESHASGHGTVTNDGHAVALLTLLLGRQGHAQRSRNAGGGMRCAKGVVNAFIAFWKTRQAAGLAQAVHLVTPTGEDFVRIGLVAHVPDQAVVRRVEHVVQGDGEFDRAQIGTQVAPGFGHAVDQVAAQFIGQRGQLGRRQSPHIGGRLNAVEQWGHEPFSCKP